MGELLKSGTIDSLAGVLKYGPLGLAGLMLILVLIAISFKEVTPNLSTLLTRFMYAGIASLGLIFLANYFTPQNYYPIHFNVLPLDMETMQKYPRPIIKMNDNIVKSDMTYLVSSEVTAIVDVSSAIDALQRLSLQNKEKDTALTKINTDASILATQLQLSKKIISSELNNNYDFQNLRPNRNAAATIVDSATSSIYEIAETAKIAINAN